MIAAALLAFTALVFLVGYRALVYGANDEALRCCLWLVIGALLIHAMLP